MHDVNIIVNNVNIIVDNAYILEQSKVKKVK